MIHYEVFLLVHFDPSENLSEFCIFPIFPANPGLIPPSTFPGHCWDPPWIAKIPFSDGKFSWFGEITAAFGVGGIKSAAFGLFLLGSPWELCEDEAGQPEYWRDAVFGASGHQIHRISPQKSPFFQTIGEKLAALGRGRGVLKNSRGWDVGQEGVNLFPSPSQVAFLGSQRGLISDRLTRN